MTAQDKVVYLGSQASSGLLQRFRQLANGRLMSLSRHMLDQVDDALFERAERAENNAVQTAFFDAMREVRLQRREIERRLEQELANRHDHPVSLNADVSGASGEELSLVDNEHLEERLAVEGMVSKARARYAHPLGNLAQRLNKAVNRERYDLDLTPVAPAQVGDAFQVASQVLEIDLRARLIIYKLFDRHVMTQLGGLYDELNRLLADAGVLPDIRPSGRVRQTQRQSREPAPGSSAGGYHSRSAPVLSDGQADALFSTLQHLVAAHKEGGGSEWAGTGYQPVAGQVDVGGLIAALSGLQNQAIQTGFDDAAAEPVWHLDAAALKQQLRYQLPGGAEQTLGRMEDDTIDIVSLLFDAILDDPALPDAIKAQIARLQIPVLKVALMDRALFSQKKHPARRLINEMARAGIGWTDSGQSGGDPLFRRIEDTVTYILEQFSDDVGVFERCLEEFRQFLSEERERTRQIEERTRQAAEGKAKVDGAKEQVEQELRRRIGHRQVPAVVGRLLDEAWSKVLFITLLKEGDDSETWRNHLETADRLLWSVQPKGEHAERKRLVSEIPGLLHDLRAGLNAIMFNPVEMTRLFKELEREHIRVLSTPASERAPDEARPAAEEPPEQPVEREEAADRGWMTAELQPFCQKLDEARIGTWFEFQQESGKPIRAKLSARLADGDRLIFVNRAGFKLADRRREELAHSLKRGRVILLDDNLLFDKALESVVANLRSLRESQGEH